MTQTWQPKALIALTLLAWAGAGAAADEKTGAGWLLTGVYGRAADGYTALVQHQDGRHTRVQSGDRLGDALVVEVAVQWILLRPEGAETTVKLWLKGLDQGPTAAGGGSGPATAAAPGGAGRGGTDTAGSLPGAPDTPGVAGAQGGRTAAGGPGGKAAGGRSVAAVPGVAGTPGAAGSPDAAAEDPGALANQGPEEAPVPEQPHGDPLPGGRNLPQVAEQLKQTLDPKESFKQPVTDLDGVLGPVLGLPAGAHIVEMASRPPLSFRDGVGQVLQAAGANEVVRLTVETPEGRQRVMVTPGSAGQPARVTINNMSAPPKP